MAKSTSRIAACILLATSLGTMPVTLFANDKTPGDRLAEYDVTLEMLQKERQINDMLGSDPILGALPAVVSVFVLQEKKAVRLAMPNGSVQTFNEGDEIAERVKLTSVAPRRVRVLIQPLPNAKSKKPVAMALQFKAAAAATSTSAPFATPAASLAPGMPAAPLAIIAPGLMQAAPRLPSPSTVWPGPTSQPPSQPPLGQAPETAAPAVMPAQLAH